MGSFYGGGGGSTGSSVTADYNKIQNTPITNVGTKTLGNFVVVSQLNEGHYNLTGYYKIDSNDTVHYIDAPLDLLIYKDTKTGYKAIQYFTTEDGIIYLNTHIYDGINCVKEDKIDLTDKSQKWDEF